MGSLRSPRRGFPVRRSAIAVRAARLDPTGCASVRSARGFERIGSTAFRPTSPALANINGGSGIRTHADAKSNALAGRRLKPLGHPSKQMQCTHYMPASCPARART